MCVQVCFCFEYSHFLEIKGTREFTKIAMHLVIVQAKRVGKISFRLCKVCRSIPRDFSLWVYPSRTTNSRGSCEARFLRVESLMIFGRVKWLRFLKVAKDPMNL